MRGMCVREKIGLITGGATGIGRRTAFQLAEKGIHLAINYRKSRDEAEELANDLSAQFRTENIIIEGDITDSHDCEHIVSEALSAFSTVDILIHNAGPYIHGRKTMADYAIDEWNYLVNGNLNAVFYLSRLIIPQMRKNKWGRIITVGFDRVETAPGWIYRSAFAAAKSGVASLTKTIAMEEAAYGITANMVCPGDITGKWKEQDIVEAVNLIDKESPIGRPGTGEDVARVISFLIEDNSDFITGSVIPITGSKDVLGKVFKDL